MEREANTSGQIDARARTWEEHPTMATYTLRMSLPTAKNSNRDNVSQLGLEKNLI